MDAYDLKIVGTIDMHGQWVRREDAERAVEEVHQSYGGQADRYEKRVAELEAALNHIRSEISCRIEHGAESNGHLEAIRDLLDSHGRR